MMCSSRHASQRFCCERKAADVTDHQNIQGQDQAGIEGRIRALFRTKSVSAVENAAGFVEATLGGPTQWTPNDYTMISTWENEQSLKDFVGDQWNEAHIPEGMERFVEACWVDHFSAF